MNVSASLKGDASPPSVVQRGFDFSDGKEGCLNFQKAVFTPSFPAISHRPPPKAHRSERVPLQKKKSKQTQTKQNKKKKHPKKKKKKQKQGGYPPGQLVLYLMS